MTLNRKKVDREKLKKAYKAHIAKNEAFLKEVAEGADFYETAEKYGKKFVAPLPTPTKN